MAKAKRRIPVEEFVEEYMKHYTQGYDRQVLADYLGVGVATVYLRANELRRLGVKLPPLPMPKRKSVAERANLIMSKYKGAKRAEIKVPKRFSNS